MRRQASILFVNRVFPPDRGATGRLLCDLAGRFALAGWRVTVVADGAASADGGLADGGPAGVRVVRSGGGGEEAPGAAGYLGALARLTATALAQPAHDVAVTMTDPPMLACLGPLLRLRHGSRLIHWCQDLYPELFPVLGVGLPRPVLTGIAALSTAALGRHDRIVAIGACMRRRLAARGLPAARLEVLPNWGQPGLRPQEPDPAIREVLAGGARFLALYAGNLGRAHPVAALAEAAAELAVTDPDVRILVAGDGRRRAALAGIAAGGTLRLLPYQDEAALARLYAAADLHLALLDPRAEGLMLPCKVAAGLAAGCPVVLHGPPGSDAARMIGDAGAVAPAGEPGALAAAIRSFARAPGRMAQARAAARHRAEDPAERWDADRAAARFLALAGSLRPGPTVPAGAAVPAGPAPP
ncbi:glycosyltransferase [Rhodocista pekingensis]|uniref:Glycosyltransferase n=1 Tax=Rhodocista pekingensis TaxID=201185 RepID=A0ABW2KXW8_9PROT